MKIKDFCEEERPREKLLSKGASSLGSAELLAILIGSGTREANVLEVANRLLSSAEGKLRTLAGMSPQEMGKTGGVGRNRYASISAALELGKRYSLEDPGISPRSIMGASDIYRIMIPFLRGLEHEECWILFLNKARRIIHKEKLSLGGISETTIDRNLIIKKALQRNASLLVLVHNHPSGDPVPGESDIKQTLALKKAASTFNIILLDHVVVCDSCFFSFADERITAP